MATISKNYTFSAGATIVAAEHNSNFDTIYTAFNGNISNSNISGSAAIAYSKLALTGGIVNADVSASAAIAASKLNLVVGSAIGTTTPAAGKFTTLEATSTFKIGTTNQGDIFYDNGTSIIRLVPGTAGQTLLSGGAGANPSWGAGGVSFVSNTSVTTATNTGNIAITNTNYYLVQAHFTAMSASGESVLFRFNNDTDSVYNSNGTAAQSSIVLSAATNNQEFDIEIKIYPQNGTGRIHMFGTAIYVNEAGTLIRNNFFGNYNDATAATSFRILTSGVVTFTAGNVYLYKYALS